MIVDLYEWLDAHGAPSDPETGFPWDEFGLLASPYPTVPAADVAQALLDHVRADLQARATASGVDLELSPVFQPGVCEGCGLAYRDAVLHSVDCPENDR